MLFERPESGERTVILQILLDGAENPDLEELKELAASAELQVVQALEARRKSPHPATFIGSGKVQELRDLLKMCRADLLLVNRELSTGQQRNLEKQTGCRVISRTELILTIFAARARSHEGQLQVELAQLKHAQTRLVRGWTHLDRQKGGIGMRGAGEKQIELDQRMISERIKVTERKLATVERRRSQNRRARDRKGTPTVALVGYTNAGKSTLFNRLSDADVYAEDQLFATLDPTMRKISVSGLNDVVLVDTVGFVSQLPHALVEAFKATLEEVAYADLLLHVVDASDPLAAERIDQVQAVLNEIGAQEVPQLVVYNKIDLLEGEWPRELPECAGEPVSAVTGAGLEQLSEKIGDHLGVEAPHEVILPVTDGKTRAWLYRSGAVLDETTLENGDLQLILQADELVIRKLEQDPAVLLRRSQAVPKIAT